MVVRHISLDHKGGFYFFRVHDQKLDLLCRNFGNLKNYINLVFNDCPNDYFNSGPRSSKLKFKLPVDLIEIKGHEVSSLAKYGLEIEKYNTAHSKVQTFMLNNDSNTVAVELPVWLEPEEVMKYNAIFSEPRPLTGHIDVLRIEDDKIWVWDYKPKANKERYAATQVYFYALMLSNRTNIPLKNFRCGYFDDKFTFVFKPEEIKLHRNEKLSEFR